MYVVVMCSHLYRSCNRSNSRSVTLILNAKPDVQAIVAQKSLSMVKAQIQSKERERRILELTIRQLATVPAEENARMFKGVGKM